MISVLQQTIQTLYLKSCWPSNQNPTHQAYFSVLIEKNIFVSGGTKEMAEDCQQHAETEHAKEVHC